MSIAGLLKPSTPYPLPPQIPRVTTTSVPTVPPVAQPKAGRFYGHNYLTGRTLIIITLGSNDMKTAVAPVQLDLGSKRTLDFYAAMSLTISAINATGERAIVDLPIKDASEPILFYVDESVPITKDVAIQFDIIPTNGARKDVVARAVAVIDGVGGKNPSVDPRNAGKVKGRGGTMAVPLMNENREIVGRIQYECRWESGGANEISWTHVYNTTDFLRSHKRIDTVVTPFCHPRMSIGSKQTYWKFVETKVGKGEARAVRFYYKLNPCLGDWTSRCWRKSCIIVKSPNWREHCTLIGHSRYGVYRVEISGNNVLNTALYIQPRSVLSTASLMSNSRKTWCLSYITIGFSQRLDLASVSARCH